MQWGSFQGLLKHPLAARLGYVNQSALQDALSVARAGDGSSLVLLQKAVSLENWLRNIAQYGVVNLEAELDLHERKLGLLKGKSQGLRTFFGMTSMKKNLISPRKVREE